VRVLLVEDEVKLASLIGKALRELGMLADLSTNGEDAPWMAGATVYDALVPDVNLPGIDGFEVCHR
jgi:two-component system OmpR family response regulator